MNRCSADSQNLVVNVYPITNNLHHFTGILKIRGRKDSVYIVIGSSGSAPNRPLAEVESCYVRGYRDNSMFI